MKKSIYKYIFRTRISDEDVEDGGGVIYCSTKNSNMPGVNGSGRLRLIFEWFADNGYIHIVSNELTRTENGSINPDKAKIEYKLTDLGYMTWHRYKL
jgi:hypothetical protein